ncbi:MAG: helix-turn-helix domain-containing protein [Actinomycetota bacterium]|nr:helix-turn-helix domain-containing protein [Actinomycetota bacterium]
MLPDDDVCYRAVRGRDARFDGWFFTAVTSTGIYCRPSCPALTPRRENVRFFASAAGAQRGGFRACKRCRPDASPGSPDWDVRADLAGRALRLIADGVVDRDGVPGLARRLGYSERQLNRTLTTEVGAGPLALARSNRAQTARVLLETTDLSATDIAFAAGFASVRQFNDTVREVFADTPSGLRGRADRRSRPGAGTIELRLPYRAPMDVDATLRWLGWHAVRGVEDFRDGPGGASYRRTLRLPQAPGRVTLSAGGPGWVRAGLELRDQRDLTAAVSRVRRLLDLDADPQSVASALEADPQLGPLVRLRPGLRSPGAVDAPEMAVRTVVGQQVSLAGASAVSARIVAEHGERAFDDDGPGWLFPSASRLAAVDPTTLPMPRARGRSVVALSAALVAGEVVLDPGVDWAAARAALLTVPGIGPWTADYVRMRALGDPDVLLAGDLAARRVAVRHGIELAGGRPDWAPWRSYATHHLWAVALATRPLPPNPSPTDLSEEN